MSCTSIADTSVCGKWSLQSINTEILSQIYGIPQADFTSKTWESAFLSDLDIAQFNGLTGCAATNIQYYLSYACFNDIFVHSASCNTKAPPLCTSVCDSYESSMDSILSNKSTCPINFNVEQLVDRTMFLRDSKNCNSKNKLDIFLGQDCLMGVGKDSSTCGFQDQSLFNNYCKDEHPCCKNVTVIPAGDNKSILPFSFRTTVILSIFGGLIVFATLGYGVYRLYHVLYKKRNDSISKEYFQKVDSDRFSIDDDKSLCNIPKTLGDNDSIIPFYNDWEDDQSIANPKQDSISLYKLELQCIAKCDYTPRSVDELEIEKGETVTFEYLYDDGWGTAAKADGTRGAACLLIMELQGEDLSPKDRDFIGPNSTLTTPDGINLHYISQFDYTAHVEGRLDIRKGDHIILRKVRADGWLEAFNVTSGHEGLTSHMLVSVDSSQDTQTRLEALQKVTLPSRSTSVAKETTRLISSYQVEEQAKMFEKYSLLLRKRTTVKSFPFSNPEAPLSTLFVCRAKNDFIPRQKDELQLSKGDVVKFLHLYDDGWGKATKSDGSAGMCCIILMEKLDGNEEDASEIVDLDLQYKVTIKYNAQASDQLDLEIGDIISIKRILENGWVQAYNHQTDKEGLITPIFLDVYGEGSLPERVSSNSEGSVGSQEQDMLYRGGQNWNGPTCCQTGSTCQYSNAWYSQCLAPQQNSPPPSNPKPNPTPKPVTPPSNPAPPKSNPPTNPKPNPPAVTTKPASPPANPIPAPVTPPSPIVKIPVSQSPVPAPIGKNQNGDGSGSDNTNPPSQSTGNSGNTSSNPNPNNNNGNTNSGNNQNGSNNGVAVNPNDSSSVLPGITIPTASPIPSESGTSGSSVNAPLVAGLTVGIVVVGVVVAMFVSYKDKVLINDDDSILGYYNDLPPKAKILPVTEARTYSNPMYSQSNHSITPVPSFTETLIAMPNQRRGLPDSFISMSNSDAIETPIISQNEIPATYSPSDQHNPTLNQVEEFVKSAHRFPKSLYFKTKSADALRDGKPRLLSTFQLVPIPTEIKSAESQ
ncbi:hypothetical protein HDV01_007136 [Terramyces sp. JEL0728]|nr:hypothetical protein HDV01_007136 [Terramyces sp. JEL0728]